MSSQMVTVDYMIAGTMTTEVIYGERVTVNLSDTGRCVVLVYFDNKVVASYMYKDAHRVNRKNPSS